MEDSSGGKTEGQGFFFGDEVAWNFSDSLGNIIILEPPKLDGVR